MNKTLYHATTKDKAVQIKKDGFMKSPVYCWGTKAEAIEWARISNLDAVVKVYGRAKKCKPYYLMTDKLPIVLRATYYQGL